MKFEGAADQVGPEHTAAAFEHVAVLYETPAGVAEQLTPAIDRDLGAGHAVLVCVGDTVAREIRQRVPAHDRLVVLDVSGRYTRPVEALNVLWRFSCDQFDAGAHRVHSIGELSFTGDPSDDDWLWYEDACNAVLAALPITGTCLYDTTQCPQRALAMVAATHEHVEPTTGAHGAAATAQPPENLTPPPVPSRGPDVSLTDVGESRPVREVLRGAELDADVVARASVVFSELVTNAVKHGGGHATVDLWFDRGGVVGQVSDRGPGVKDRFATVRLPRFDDHGLGLWLSNLEADRLVVEPGAPQGTVVTALISPS